MPCALTVIAPVNFKTTKVIYFHRNTLLSNGLEALHGMENCIQIIQCTIDIGAEPNYFSWHAQIPHFLIFDGKEIPFICLHRYFLTQYVLKFSFI